MGGYVSMIYKIDYELDDGYAKQDMSVVINSGDVLSTDTEVKDFLYKHVHKRSDDLVKIYSFEHIVGDYEDKVILKKVVRF